MEHLVRRAGPADYQNLIDFATMVFSEDFPHILPKLYNGHPEVSGRHWIVLEEGRIRAAAGLFPLELQVGGKILRAEGIGTVSVHPYSRGKGYMKELMEKMMEDARQEGADLICLGGQRQRYEYFGFGEGPVQIAFTVTPDNRRHCRAVSTKEIELLPLDENGEYLNLCRKLHESQPLFVRREGRAFGEILHSWSSAGWVILENGEFSGYASISETGETVQELVLKDDSAALKAIFRIVEHCGKPVVFFPGWEQDGLIRAFQYVAESAELRNGEMVNILNYPRVLEAFLGLKAQRAGILDGRYVIEVREAGKFAITAENGTVRVTETEEEANLSLPHLKMMPYLFSAASAPLYRNELERSWLAVPLTLPSADMV